MNWSKDARLVARFHSVVYIVPFLSPHLVLCSLSFIFTPSIHILKNSPCVLSCAVPNGSLRSFTSKDVFVPFSCLQRCGPRQTKAWKYAAVALHLWFTECWGWSKRQRSGEATSDEVPGCISFIKGQAGITYPSHVTWHKSCPRPVYFVHFLLFFVIIYTAFTHLLPASCSVYLLINLNLPVEPVCLTHVSHVLFMLPVSWLPDCRPRYQTFFIEPACPPVCLDLAPPCLCSIRQPRQLDLWRRPVNTELMSQRDIFIQWGFVSCCKRD